MWQVCGMQHIAFAANVWCVRWGTYQLQQMCGVWGMVHSGLQQMCGV